MSDTTDAAKLLRDLAANATPTNEGEGDRVVLTSETKFALLRIACEIEANSRPQPAPPAGEPDFKELWFKSLRREGAFDLHDAAAKFGERMYRRGLAARPKVDDAEALAADLKKTQIELDSEFHRAKSAEAKLAEREAELAKARELIYANVDPMDMHPKYRETYDAARQQQKASAESTERNGE